MQESTSSLRLLSLVSLPTKPEERKIERSTYSGADAPQLVDNISPEETGATKDSGSEARH